jgi:quercetin dioxygenase-like cupin family protein
VGYYHNWEEFSQKQVSYLQGHPEASKLLIRIASAEKIMLTQIRASRGALVPNHHHEAEQIIMVFKGKMLVTTDNGDETILEPGSIWIVPSNTPHSVYYAEDTEAIEIVSPIRLDNFSEYTVSHTFFDE